MTNDSISKQIQQLSRAGDSSGALSLVASALRRNDIDSNEHISLGKHINRLISVGSSTQAHLNILVLGQTSTQWLTPAIAASTLQINIPCLVKDGAYDNILQELSCLEPSDVPDALILTPWNERLLSSNTTFDQRIAFELAFWKNAWRIAAEKKIKRLIQIGYDWVVPGALGYHLDTQSSGDIDLIRQLNARLKDALPDSSYFVPLEHLSGDIGRRNFYDMRNLHWIRQPYSEDGLVVLSNHIAAGLRALTSGPKKLLVVDLDNTLWGGIVGEVGPLSIELSDSASGEAFKAFQRHLLALSRRGVLLAVCSKNNDSDAKEVFVKNPDMVLKLEDFASFVANWEPKTVGIERIAKQLRIGLDSVVFFDDSSFERDMVRQALPQVQVVNVPDDPSEYIRALQSSLCFETCKITQEDLSRAQLYQSEAQYLAASGEYPNVSDYLKSLNMRATIRRIEDSDMARVVQLLTKTNQFNFTTRRHTADEVRHLLSTPGSIGLTLRLKDCFLDHGLVALVLAVPQSAEDSTTLVIDSFLMSCRVIGRTAEVCILNALIREAQSLGFKRLLGVYSPTTKNELVEHLYSEWNFTQLKQPLGNAVVYELNLHQSTQIPSLVHDLS